MPDLGGVISGAANSGATLRTGRVVKITGTSIDVDVGGSTLTDLPYLASYVPVLGDPVITLQQGAVQAVLGATAGMGDNEIANPSFETDAPGATAITNWTIYRPGGSAVVAAVKVDTASGWGPAADGGRQWLEMNQASAGLSQTYMVSDPIAVVPGQVWTAAASWVSFADAGSSGSPAVTLALAWLASVAATYPTTVTADTELQVQLGPVGAMPSGWAVLRELAGTGQIVPASAYAMRVVLKVEMTDPGATYLDKVIARRVG